MSKLPVKLVGISAASKQYSDNNVQAAASAAEATFFKTKTGSPTLSMFPLPPLSLSFQTKFCPK